MKKSKDTDYLFLSSYLQAKQAHGLEGIDSVSAFREAESMSPNPDIVRFFRLKYDYHNVKVYLKSIASGADNSRLYSMLGRISPDRLTDACRSGDYRSLPGTFAAAVKNAAETLERTLDPRMADFILDRAYVAELQETAKLSGSPFLEGYAALYADALNLRALTRMLKSGVRPEMAGTVLYEGGRVSAASILNRYPDAGTVIGLFRSTGLSPALAEAEKAAAGEGFTSFERAVQACLDSYMSGAKTICFGEEVLIRYLYLVEGKHT